MGQRRVEYAKALQKRQSTPENHETWGDSTWQRNIKPKKEVKPLPITAIHQLPVAERTTLPNINDISMIQNEDSIIEPDTSMTFVDIPKVNPNSKMKKGTFGQSKSKQAIKQQIQNRRNIQKSSSFRTTGVKIDSDLNTRTAGLTMQRQDVRKKDLVRELNERQGTRAKTSRKDLNQERVRSNTMERTLQRMDTAISDALNVSNDSVVMGPAKSWQELLDERQREAERRGLVTEISGDQDDSWLSPDLSNSLNQSVISEISLRGTNRNRSLYDSHLSDYSFIWPRTKRNRRYSR